MLLLSCSSDNLVPDPTKYTVNKVKLEKLKDAVSSLITEKADAELETLHALQDLLEEMQHPESQFHFIPL
jgi:hypothetical protein